MPHIGIHADMPNAEYHAHPAIGSSGLKLLKQSPAHYWARYLDPNREWKEPTPAMRFGTAWHAAIFEPDLFAAKFVELPEGLDRRSKEGKALYAELTAGGREPFDADAMKRIRAACASANAHPITRVIFDQQGAAEQSLFWVDADSGAHCKIRPDYAVAPCELFPNGLLVDGKTGEDMSPAGFAKYAWNWELHIQAAFYADGFQAVYGTKAPPLFAWMAQEKDAPFATAYYSASDDFLAYGRKLYRPLLRRLVECQQSGYWPAYGTAVMPLELPAWAEKQVQDGVAA